MSKDFKQAVQDIKNSIGILERQSKQPRLSDYTRKKILFRIEVQKESIHYFEKGYNFKAREVKQQENVVKNVVKNVDDNPLDQEELPL